jgi:hypothetical protein
MGKYLDILDANDRREAEEQRRLNDINDNNDINSEGDLCRLDRLCRNPGLPHPVYGHDVFSLIRLPHPAILRSRRRP